MVERVRCNKCGQMAFIINGKLRCQTCEASGTSSKQEKWSSQPPPAPPPINPPAQPSREAHNSPDLKSSTNSRRWSKPSTIIAFVMLGISLLLPVSMYVITTLRINSALDEVTAEDMNLSSNPHDFFPDESIEEAKIETYALGLIFGSFFDGICCPFSLYFLLMLILGTAFIAFRSAGA